MPYKSRRTIRKKIIGSMLKRARIAAGVEVKQVVEVTGMSRPVVYRQEDGIAPVLVETIPDLAKLYGVTDPDMIARWTKWANRSSAKGDWGTFGSTLGPTYEDYADVESLAVEIRAYEPAVVHGLLQTTRYSEEVINASASVRPGPTPSEHKEQEDRLKLRQARKGVLTREEPPAPRLWAVLGEAAVRTPPSVTDGTAHRDQIQHLLNLGETSASIQILTLNSGLHTGLSGSFSILTLDDNVDMVFREGYGDSFFTDDENRIRSYRARYERLQSQALPIADSRRYLHKLLTELGN
ncbi:helix-turn-helix transcriptional regulator [Streptomyces sp. NPDC048281]|uniref:helix-turn-helix domain-containing protein n=1 Tax=Streptomyces sp. NPDC048281 TaxID=3154715 RepID=UPI00341395F7